MGTIHLTPGSIGFSKGSDRSGHVDAGFRKTVDRSNAGALRLIWNTLLQWQRGYEMRRRLATMDDRTLRDIGITRLDAQRAAQRMFRLF